jgi:hypothetical protein
MTMTDTCKITTHLLRSSARCQRRISRCIFFCRLGIGSAGSMRVSTQNSRPAVMRRVHICTCKFSSPASLVSILALNSVCFVHDFQNRTRYVGWWRAHTKTNSTDDKSSQACFLQDLLERLI